VVGITGAPGSGKSTLVDRLVTKLRARGERVAVLALDPTSPVSGGAVLGDRVRMQAHATDPGVLVRSMASRGAPGGLADAAPDAVRVLDAAGWRWVLVETVGVGQGAMGVSVVADTAVVVVTPEWGDEVQAAKAGVLEVADVVVLNRSDAAGGAAAARAELGAQLRAPVVATVATCDEGVPALLAAIDDHRARLVEGGLAHHRRRLMAELRWVVGRRGGETALAHCEDPAFERAAESIVAGFLDPRSAAEQLLADVTPR
jgi:LAO/AO transport system kinase